MKQRMLCLLCLLSLFGLGFAQQPLETSGTITATLGGEERVWHTVVTKAPDVRVNTANWMLIENSMMSLHTFMLSAYPGEGVTLADVQVNEGMLELTVNFFGELPEACPCTVDGVITYATSDELVDKQYVNEEVTFTLSELRRIDESSFAVKGSFDTSLMYREDYMEAPDPSNTLDISGSFEATLEPAGNQLAD